MLCLHCHSPGTRSVRLLSPERRGVEGRRTNYPLLTRRVAGTADGAGAVATMNLAKVQRQASSHHWSTLGLVVAEVVAAPMTAPKYLDTEHCMLKMQARLHSVVSGFGSKGDNGTVAVEVYAAAPASVAAAAAAAAVAAADGAADGAAGAAAGGCVAAQSTQADVYSYSTEDTASDTQRWLIHNKGDKVMLGLLDAHGAFRGLYWIFSKALPLFLFLGKDRAQDRF